MKKRGIILSFLVVSILTFMNFNILSETFIVDGNISYVFEVTSKDEAALNSFYEYSNESNSQKVIKREPGKITVQNDVNLGFFKSNVSFPISESNYNTDEFKEHLDFAMIRRGYKITKINGQTIKEDYTERIPLTEAKITFLKTLANDLTKNSTTQKDAVESIITYIREKVSYQLGTSSDPVDVIKSRKAYCEGYAYALIMLLRAVGIPAKFVSCYIPPGHMWGSGGGLGAGGGHAFVDVFYKDIGWVSYDPQASVHFVDPFHIVDFDSSIMKIKEISISDNIRPIDCKKEPLSWRDFLHRKSDDNTYSGLIRGIIINRKGEQVKDSYKTNEWLFLYDDNTGKGEGVRILESGYFAIPVFELDKPLKFYYNDSKNRGYFQTIISLDKKEVNDYKFDLSDKENTVILKSKEKNKKITIWNRKKNDWGLNDYQTDSNGTLALLVYDWEYVVNQSSYTSDPRYLLTKDVKGEIFINDLPYFFEEESNYIYGNIKGKNGEPLKAEITIKEPNGRYFSPFKTDDKGNFCYLLDDIKYNIVIIESKGILISKTVDFKDNKKAKIEYNLKESNLSKIISNQKNTKIYFLVKKNDRYYEYFKSTTDENGELLFMIPVGTYYISVGKSFSENMKEIIINDSREIVNFNVD